MSIYVVSWSRALGGDDIPTDAFCGVLGAFTDLSKAKQCMRHDVDAMLEEIRNGFEDDEDLDDFENSLSFSDDDFFIEIDYTTPDNTRVQWYYSVQEVDVES